MRVNGNNPKVNTPPPKPAAPKLKNDAATERKPEPVKASHDKAPRIDVRA